MALGGDRPDVTHQARPRVDVGAAGDVGSLLVALDVEESVNRPSRCVITLDDTGSRGGFRFDNDRSIDFGAAVAVSLQSGGGTFEPSFAGRVFALARRMDHDRGPRLIAEAHDRLRDLAMARRSRHVEETTAADVIASTAADHGFAADIALDGPAHAVLVQANETDLAFLTRLVGDLDGELWLDGDTLHASHHTARPGATVTVSPNSDLFSLAIDADLTDQHRDLTVHGWDPAIKQPLAETADYEAIADEVTGQVSGGQWLAILDVPGPDPRQRFVHRLPDNIEHTESLANTTYAAASRRFVTLRALARGRAELRVGAKIDLQGAGARFDGTYAISRTRHTFDAENGYRTEFDARRSGLGR